VPYGLSEDQPLQQVAYVESLERAAGSGPGAMMEVFLRLVGADDDALAATRNSDEWPPLVALEHTLAYDAAAMGTGQPPVDRLGRITVPTLVMSGAPEGEHEVGSTAFFEAAAQAIARAISVSGTPTRPRADPCRRSQRTRTRALCLLQELGPN
jgi:hypothetical protein